MTHWLEGFTVANQGREEAADHSLFLGSARSVCTFTTLTQSIDSTSQLHDATIALCVSSWGPSVMGIQSKLSGAAAIAEDGRV
jgi:hypothetical protein